MNYEFPRIECIEDVLPAIKGRDEFVVAHREWGTVINYMVSMSDTFPDVDSPTMALRRECRGLLFYPDGRIMSRRLHKFFNVNEREETAAQRIDLSRPHVILEKLDGSMITPVYTDKGIRWGTKMGITDVGQQAEQFVNRHSVYQEFAAECRIAGVTPIFEWCSRKQRIVVDYPEDRLVLIAMRNNVTGAYTSFQTLKGLGSYWHIPVVRAYAGTSHNMQSLVDETRASEGMEGWIIRFDDGQMLKVKGEWYLRIHKTKDGLTLEKNVIDMIVNEKLDDVKPFMLDEDRRRVEAFEKEFWDGVANSVEIYERYFQSVVSSGLDRKSYALQYMPTVKDNDPFAPSYVFARFDGKDPRTLVLEAIRKNIGTQTKVDAARNLWRGARWNYLFDGDA